MRMTPTPTLQLSRTARALQLSRQAHERARLNFVQAVGDAYDAGMSFQRIADYLAELGRPVSRSRVQQLVEESRRVRTRDRVG